MSVETLYWHDYETSGASPASDRPWQFAGLRTTTDLEIIGDPLTVYAKPALDVLPHPAAVRVTGISPFEAEAKGLSEQGFIARIHDELSQPGTCGVGYTPCDLMTRSLDLRCGVISMTRTPANTAAAIVVGI